MNGPFTTDDRAVSEVIGAILVFGLLVTLLAIMQMQAVPAANAGVEANHNQGVQSDLINFMEASSRTAAQGTTESTRIQMGTTYPTRLVFFNPSQPAGTIRTNGSQTGSIENIRATDDNILKYIGNGPSGNSIEALEMKSLEYEPAYNEFQNAPTTVFEYGMLYNDYGDQYLIQNEGRIISGNTIDLTFFGGDLSRTSSTALSLESRPASAPTRTVTVEPTDQYVELVLPSNLPASEWNDLLSDERNFVDATQISSSLVEIRLDGSVSRYELRMTQIGVGSNIPHHSAEYLVPSDGHSTSTIGARANTLPFEARDTYNNPARGETVNITVSQGQFGNGQDSIEATTNQQGKPSLNFTSNTAGVVEVKASFRGDPGDSSYTFDPANDPADLKFEFLIDPSQDDLPPIIDNLDVIEETFSTCQDFTSIPGASLLGCATTTPYSQLSATYELSEVGGSGLDYIEIIVYDEDDDIALITTHNVDGSESVGTFWSPQINRDITGDLERVEVIVYDHAGNTVEKEFDL